LNSKEINYWKWSSFIVQGLLKRKNLWGLLCERIDSYQNIKLFTNDNTNFQVTKKPGSQYNLSNVLAQILNNLNFAKCLNVFISNCIPLLIIKLFSSEMHSWTIYMKNKLLDPLKVSLGCINKLYKKVYFCSWNRYQP
jgi:hypothetical protein